MVAKGKDASDLFPAVVKNVVSKNIEVLLEIFNHLAIGNVITSMFLTYM